MNDRSTRDEWAWQHVEAFADDSLEAREQARMRAALRGDPALRAAVDRASAVAAGLTRLSRAPAPAGLLARLLAVPGGRASRVPRLVLLAVPFAVAAVVAILVIRPAPQVAAEDPEMVAVREFTVAMHYLQKTAAYTGGEVGGFVSTGLRDAVVASRNSLFDESEDENGG